MSTQRVFQWTVACDSLIERRKVYDGIKFAVFRYWRVKEREPLRMSMLLFIWSFINSFAFVMNEQTQITRSIQQQWIGSDDFL